MNAFNPIKPREITTESKYFDFTHHCAKDNIPLQSIQTVLDYGRMIHRQGLCYFIIGRQEINKYRKKVVDISLFNGVHVVCNTSNNKVIHVFRDVKLKILRTSLRRRPYPGHPGAPEGSPFNL